MKEIIYKIYSLLCPFTKAVRYIGYTKLEIEERAAQHFEEEGTTHKCKWIMVLKLKDVKPLVKLIETNIVTVKEAKVQEVMYIKFFKFLGARLVNETIGGDGGDTFSHRSEKSKNKTRERISKSHSGVQFTEQHCDNISIKLKNVPKTKEHCNNVSIGTKLAMANMDEDKKKEMLRKRSETMLNRELSDEHCKAIGEGNDKAWEIRRQNGTDKNGPRSKETKAKAAAKRAANKQEIDRKRAEKNALLPPKKVLTEEDKFKNRSEANKKKWANMSDEVKKESMFKMVATQKYIREKECLWSSLIRKLERHKKKVNKKEKVYDYFTQKVKVLNTPLIYFENYNDILNS